MNKINPAKLLKSKWTAVNPQNKEKHFIVSEIEFNEDQVVASCCMEAVFSNRTVPIDWHDLKDDSRWQQGWK